MLGYHMVLVQGPARTTSMFLSFTHSPFPFPSSLCHKSLLQNEKQQASRLRTEADHAVATLTTGQQAAAAASSGHWARPTVE